MTAEANVARPVTVEPGFMYRRIIENAKTVHGIVVAADADLEGNVTISAIETGTRWVMTVSAVTFTNDNTTVLFPAVKADFDLALIEAIAEVNRDLATAELRVAQLGALKARVEALLLTDILTVPALTEGGAA